MNESSPCNLTYCDQCNGVTHTFSDIRHCRSLGTSVFKMKWVKLAPQGFILQSTHYCAQKSGIKISED